MLLGQRTATRALREEGRRVSLCPAVPAALATILLLLLGTAVDRDRGERRSEWDLALVLLNVLLVLRDRYLLFNESAEFSFIFLL